jgi:hypothetical protein
MESSSPETICTPRHTPRTDPQFHQVEIELGHGNEMKEALAIFARGCVFVIGNIDKRYSHD